MKKIFVSYIALVLMHNTFPQQVYQRIKQPDVKSDFTNTISTRQFIMSAAIICVSLCLYKIAKDYSDRKKLEQKDNREERFLGACKLGYLEQAAALLKENTHINYQDKDGDTALMVAAFDNNEKVVEFLVEHAANCFIRNKAGLSAYDYALAKSKQNQKILTLLRDAATKVFEKIVLNGSNIEHFETALAAGANINAFNKVTGLTLLERVYQNDPYMAAKLIDRGAHYTTGFESVISRDLYSKNSQVIMAAIKKREQQKEKSV